MKLCKDCEQFDSYRSPGTTGSHWHGFGLCKTASVTLGENDPCMHDSETMTCTPVVKGGDGYAI